jgi:uroporphyrinogen decarboxylase
MRQAGRYHSHYQALRARHSFIELCKNPELAAQVTLGPITDFDFDVAILFSDLLFPLEAMGMGLSYDPAPRLGWHLNHENLKNLKTGREAVQGIEFQFAAMKRTREVLPSDKSLIGFVGGPWTLFTYAVEGAHKGGLEKSKKQLPLFEPFCDKLIPLLLENIQLQLDGGAEVVMIFDTAAGELSPQVYRESVIPQIAKLAEKFPGRLGYYAQKIHRSYLAHPLFEKDLWCGIGYDHRWELGEVLTTQHQGFVQGNFDQSLLFLEPDDFSWQVKQYLSSFQKLSAEQRAGWVCGLGHGVLPGTPEQNVKTFIKMVREVFK